MSAPCLVFFGTPEAAVFPLAALAATPYRPAVVVTAPDAPAGRGLKPRASAVKRAARALGLAVLEPARAADLVAPLGALSPAVGVLFAYGKILPPALLAVFRQGILNLHPSLLPSYRGPAPVAQAIVDGATHTGVSIIRLDDQVDHGPIVLQQTCAIEPHDTAATLLARLVKLGGEALVKILPQYLAGGIALQPQDDTQATYTRTVQRDDGLIDWLKPAEHVYRQYRAYFPWPGVFTRWQGKRLKLLTLQPAPPEKQAALPGTVHIEHGQLTVACGDGGIVLLEVQREGKRPVTADEFLRGYPAFDGARLEHAPLHPPLPTVLRPR